MALSLSKVLLLLLWAFPPSALVVAREEVAHTNLRHNHNDNNDNDEDPVREEEYHLYTPKAAPAEMIPRSYAAQLRNHKAEDSGFFKEVMSFFKFPTLPYKNHWTKESHNIPIDMSPRQLGDLGPSIIPLIDNVLEGQRTTINNNISPNIQDPIPVGVTGTAPGGTISNGGGACDGVAAQFAYDLTQITGTASTTSVNNITTASFQGLSFRSDTCELALSDSLIRFIGTGTLWNLPGTITASAPTCPTAPTFQETYTINAEIANTFFIAAAAIAFGGSLSSGGISVTTLTLNVFTLTAGTATTTIPGLSTGNFASVAPTIQTETENQVNSYLQGSFVPTVSSQFESAINSAFASVTGIWAEDPPMIYLPQGLVAEEDYMPSRWQIARMWVEDLLEKQNWFGF